MLRWNHVGRLPKARMLCYFGCLSILFMLILGSTQVSAHLVVTAKQTGECSMNVEIKSTLKYHVLDEVPTATSAAHAKVVSTFDSQGYAGDCVSCTS